MDTEQEIIRLTRDVDINQAIYLQLLNKQQELNILKASSQGNARVVDWAFSGDEVVKPKKKILVFSGFILFFFIISFYYIVSYLLRHSLTPETLQEMGIENFANIPFSKLQKINDLNFKRFNKGTHARSNTILSLTNPDDLSVEALRALRTNIYFNTSNKQGNIVLISGTSPEVGKSFVATNLAIIMAQSGKKVLLIDADLRMGYLHELLGNEKKIGLAELYKNIQIIQTTIVENLHFVSTGESSVNSAETLLHHSFNKFLEIVKKHYDYIVIDTPPVLLLTDAVIIAKYANLKLLVGKFVDTDIKEIEMSIAKFKTSKIDISGVIINGVKEDRLYGSSYGKYYKQYKK